jgi:ribonuclease HI
MDLIKKDDTENILFDNVVTDNQTKGTYWLVTWYFDDEDIDTDYIKEKLENFPYIKWFVFQVETGEITQKLHAHICLGLQKSDTKPLPQFKKRFPNCHIQNIKKYVYWQSYCCKDETRLEDTQPIFYEVESSSIPIWEDDDTSFKKSSSKNKKTNKSVIVTRVQFETNSKISSTIETLLSTLKNKQAESNYYLNLFKNPNKTNLSKGEILPTNKIGIASVKRIITQDDYIDKLTELGMEITSLINQMAKLEEYKSNNRDIESDSKYLATNVFDTMINDIQKSENGRINLIIENKKQADEIKKQADEIKKQADEIKKLKNKDSDENKDSDVEN